MHGSFFHVGDFLKHIDGEIVRLQTNADILKNIQHEETSFVIEGCIDSHVLYISSNIENDFKYPNQQLNRMWKTAKLKCDISVRVVKTDGLYADIRIPKNSIKYAAVYELPETYACKFGIHATFRVKSIIAGYLGDMLYYFLFGPQGESDVYIENSGPDHHSSCSFSGTISYKPIVEASAARNNKEIEVVRPVADFTCNSLIDYFKVDPNTLTPQWMKVQGSRSYIVLFEPRGVEWNPTYRYIQNNGIKSSDTVNVSAVSLRFDGDKTIYTIDKSTHNLRNNYIVYEKQSP